MGAKTLYIEPGSPWENGYVESFNAKLRDELLDREIFYTLREAQVLTGEYKQTYNRIPAAQLAGLQAAGAGSYPACGARPGARRTNIIGGTSLGGRSTGAGPAKQANWNGADSQQWLFGGWVPYDESVIGVIRGNNSDDFAPRKVEPAAKRTRLAFLWRLGERLSSASALVRNRIHCLCGRICRDSRWWRPSRSWEDGERELQNVLIRIRERSKRDHWRCYAVFCFLDR